ncbi:hypothetical protein [Kitasatospora sp. GAS1066B]
MRTFADPRLEGPGDRRQQLIDVALKGVCAGLARAALEETWRWISQ